MTLSFALWNFTLGRVYALEVFFFRHNLRWSASTVGLVGMLAGIVPVLLSLIGP